MQRPRLIQRMSVAAIGLVERFDRWLDAAFPLAVGLLCLDQRTPAFLVLLVWLIWRLSLQIPRQPLVLVFLVLLGAQAGLFVLERDLQPSSASDPLVIALGFVAMAGRSSQQWRNTLAWIALSVLPLGIWAAGQDPTVRLDLPVGGLNRLGFLLGLLQLSGWASIWLSRVWPQRLAFAALTVATVPMILHNGSRVALLAPLLAVLASFTAALWIKRPLERLPSGWELVVPFRRAWTLALTGLLLMSLLLVLRYWYFSPAVARVNILSDRGRIETAQCWARQPWRKGGARLLLGLGYNDAVQKRCLGRQLPALDEVGRREGLPHAHNLFAQVMAENGLLGMSSLAVVIGLLIWRLLGTIFAAPGFTSAKLVFVYGMPLLVYLLLNGLVSSFQLFLMSNQLLIGLGLAAFWADMPRSE